jgi:hypothetical protein
MKRLLALGLMLGLLGLGTAAPGADKADKEKEKVMEGLRELHEFIGGWKGSAQKRPGKPLPRDPFYAEELDWSWRFKGDDVWLSLKTKSGKFLESGELRYLPAKKQYVFVGRTPEKKQWNFTGKLDGDKLTLERTDPDTKEIQQIRLNTAAEGIRLILVAQRKDAGGTIWKPEVFIQTTRIGESLARTEKKNECVVSGGRGTSTVSYNGETFYVCCSGCADAFKENPKKYVDEFKAKKK